MRRTLLLLVVGISACRSPNVANEDLGAPSVGGSLDGGAAGGGAPDGGVTLPLPPPGRVCNGSGWCWENPLPQGNEPAAVYAAAADDAWIAGKRGMLFHWNGTAMESVGLTDVDLTALWGDGPNDVWLVGKGGFSAHWDGAGWTQEPAGEQDLHAVWGANGEVWAVGARATALRWNGASWTAPPPGPDPLEDYWAVWLDEPGDVWVGAEGALHFDGTSWTRHVELRDTVGVLPVMTIWGRSSSNVWATTPSSVAVWHWDGQSWSRFDTSTVGGCCFAVGGTATANWFLGSDFIGSSSSGPVANEAPEISEYRAVSVAGLDAWVVGNDDSVVFSRATILHKSADGSWANLMRGAQTRGFFSVWGWGPDDIWAGGIGEWHDALLHFDGSRWSPVPVPGDHQVALVDAIGGSGPHDVWIAAWPDSEHPHGQEIFHWDGSAWSSTWKYPLGDGASRIWVSGPRDAWAIGQTTTLHWDGNAWSKVQAFAPNAPFAVWGTAADNVWAGGTNALAHWNGHQWAMQPLALAGWAIFSIWGTGASDIWAVGYLGSQGLALHFDGREWTQMSIPQDQVLLSVNGTSATDVYAINGSNGNDTILHWDGSTWSVEHTGAEDLQAVWGVAGQKVVAFGQRGAILSKPAR